jgi:8-oxo-dGTP pyrophosphatase MutT (NUDIX family)
MKEEKRFRIYIAAYLVLIKNKKLLFARRCNTGYQDGNYSLVSGHFDGGETAKQCIIREVMEEIGIKLNPEKLEIVHIMHRNGKDREYIDIYLKTDTWEGNIKNLEPDKCDDLKWFSLDNLPKNVVPEIKKALKDIFKNKNFYGEAGWEQLSD